LGEGRKRRVKKIAVEQKRGSADREQRHLWQWKINLTTKFRT
jgi:hypothetical protein